MFAFRELKFKQVTESIEKKDPIAIGKLGQRIKDIREILGMTQAQMAKRLNIKQPSLSEMEDNIENSKLSTVLKVIKALDCEFLGVIASKKPIKKRLHERAEKIAKRVLKRTYANMAMEEQAPDQKEYKHRLKNLIDEFVKNPGPELWED
ncbi:MAG: helix-turn-helix transcriptional regulator [Candidatus Margulisiibacteriota bacterium]